MSGPGRLGKYAISEVLGKGAMGVVYKGFDPHIRRTVALKTIRKELIDDDQAASTLLARFQNEAQAAGRLSHPGIVAVYEWGEADDLVFLAMEYVQGNSLREYFNRGSNFDERNTVSIMAQLLDALHYAHEQGVWHRDIKPANIIIMNNGKLKVADFGIARIDTSNLTQAGVVMGTPGYMAPEQYGNDSVDWRADLFSAGVVLYQLLTGSRPFIGNTETLAYKICHEQPVPPSQADPGRCTAQFDVVAMKALAKDPALRYQNANAFREAMLEAYAAPVSPAVSEDTIINEPIRSSAQHDPSQPSQGSNPWPRAQSSSSSGSLPDPAKPTVKTIPPPGWDAAVLKQIELQLNQIVGPVAKVLVRRGATGTTDIDRLYHVLGETLTVPAERAKFLAGRQALKGVPPPEIVPTTVEEAPTQRSPTGVRAEPLTPEAIEKATRRLTSYIGPIAKVVAKKAAAQATSRKHFYTLLAENVANSAERARFLSDVGAD
jgi:serine/threonine protein kinase